MTEDNKKKKNWGIDMTIKAKLYLSIWVAITLISIFIITRIMAFNAIDKETKKVTLSAEIKTAVSELGILLYSNLLNRHERKEKQWELRYESGLSRLQKAEEEGEDIIQKMAHDYLSLGRFFMEELENYDYEQKLIKEGASGQELFFAGESTNRSRFHLLMTSQSIISSAKQLQDQAFVRLDKIHEYTRNSAYLFSILMLIIITAILYRLSMEITISLHRLQTGTQIIGQGNLNYKIDVNGQDEFAQVSRAFNQMTDNLKTTIASRDELKLLFEQFPIGISLLDRNLKIISANSALEKILDITEDGLKQGIYKKRSYIRPDGSPMPPEEFASTRSIQEEHVISNVETGVVTESGRIIWTIVSALPFPSIGQGVLIATADISERKMAEDLLRKSEAWLSAVIKSVGDGMIITDAEGRTVYINPVAEALMGWKQAEAKDRPLDEIFKIINEETGQQVENPVLRVIREGVIVELANHTILIAKDGTRTPIDDSAAPIMDEMRKCCIGVVLVFRDVTERRIADKKIKEAMQAKSAFTSMVSHELRTPLSALKESVSLMAEGAVGPVNREQESFLLIARNNIDRLARLINDVLDFQSLELGKMSLKMEANDLNKIVNEVRDTMLPMAVKKHLDFNLNLGDDLPLIKFDRDKIIQVLTNLINNSLKLTENGGLTITTCFKDNFVQTSVEDTGPGIKEEDMQQLFHEFHQLVRKVGGTGLGLAISQKIITAHGGKIWAESQFGNGTTFHFVLPVT